MHQFVVKLKAVTSLNRMSKGFEPSTETLHVMKGHRSIEQLMFQLLCVSTIFLLFWYFELCGILGGLLDHLKVDILCLNWDVQALVLQVPILKLCMEPIPMDHQDNKVIPIHQDHL